MNEHRGTGVAGQGDADQDRVSAQRGQAAPLVAAVAALAMATTLGVARLGTGLIARAEAQGAADAAALSGAVQGRRAAAVAARANGAVIVSWEQRGWFVRVVVERAGEAARATAEWRS